MVGSDGAECARATADKKQMILARVHTMKAQRTPTAPYPYCQVEALSEKSAP